MYLKSQQTHFLLDMQTNHLITITSFPILFELADIARSNMQLSDSSESSSSTSSYSSSRSSSSSSSTSARPPPSSPSILLRSPPHRPPSLYSAARKSNSPVLNRTSSSSSATSPSSQPTLSNNNNVCRGRYPNGLLLEVTRLGTDGGISVLLLGNKLGNVLVTDW